MLFNFYFIPISWKDSSNPLIYIRNWCIPVYWVLINGLMVYLWEEPDANHLLDYYPDSVDIWHDIMLKTAFN